VDYKDLFKKVENAIAVYTSELDHTAGGADPEVLLQDRLKKGKERLDNAMEALALLCGPPKGELEYPRAFSDHEKPRLDRHLTRQHRCPFASNGTDAVNLRE
jgi:type I restriction enzyme R subunit